PGLIEGAAEGAGVGDRFLGHVERTRLLLHLIDGSAENPVDAWRIVRGELDQYGAGLTGKTEVIALTKSDLIDDNARGKIVKALGEGHRVAALTRRDQPPRDGLDWIAGDLQDREALRRLVDGADAIIHVAGTINANAAGFEKGNVQGTLAMLAAATAGGVRR